MLTAIGNVMSICTSSGVLAVLLAAGIPSQTNQSNPEQAAPQPEQRLVRIELTEPAAGPLSLVDPAVAADWPAARRARAGALLLDGRRVELTDLVNLLGGGAAHAGADRPGVELRVARSRPSPDLAQLLDTLGRAAIEGAGLRIIFDDARSRLEPIDLYLSDSLPTRQSLADPSIAGDWPKVRQDQAMKLFVEGQSIAKADLRATLRRLRALRGPGWEKAELGWSATLQVAQSRVWSDVTELIHLLRDPAAEVRVLNIQSVAWDERAPVSAPRLRLRGEGLFGVQWDLRDGCLEIRSVSPGNAKEAGVAAGDRIVAIDGKAIESEDQVTAIRDGVARGEHLPVLFDIQRGSKRLRYLVAPGIAAPTVAHLATAPQSADGSPVAVHSMTLELTENAPSAATLTDPAIAADWPEARRKRANQILVGGQSCELAKLGHRLRASWTTAGTSPAKRLLVQVAGNRPWADVANLIAALPHDEERARVLVVSAGIPSQPQVVEILFGDAMPALGILADPIVAADWPRLRQERAGRIWVDDRAVAAKDIPGAVRRRLPPPPGDGRRSLKCVVYVANTRPWGDVVAAVAALGDAALHPCSVEIIPLTWSESAALATAKRLRLRGDGKYGIHSEWAADGAVLTEVSDNAKDAGMQVGDKWISVDGRPFRDRDELAEIRDEINEGKRVLALIDVVRGGQMHRYVITK